MLVQKFQRLRWVLCGVFTLLLSGCERIDPNPETDVLLQSQGSCAGQSCLFELKAQQRQGLGPRFVFQVRSFNDDQVLFQGDADSTGLAPLTSSSSPLQREESENGIQVSQSFSTQQKFHSTSSNGTILRLQGLRWLQYSEGLLKRGLNAEVTLEDSESNGLLFRGLTGRFMRKKGTTTQVNWVDWNEVSVGTSWSIQKLGASTLIHLSLPQATGRVEQGDLRHAFWWDKSENFRVDPQVSGLRWRRKGSDQIEFEDSMKAELQLPELDHQGSAQARFSYRLVVKVDRSHVKIEGTSRLKGWLKFGDQVEDLESSQPKLMFNLSW